MSPADVFNACEAVWWIACGVTVACSGSRLARLSSRRRIILAALLIAFGISDVIEIRTGAWWRPTGLLIFKSVTLTGIVILGVKAVRQPGPGPN